MNIGISDGIISIALVDADGNAIVRTGWQETPENVDIIKGAERFHSIITPIYSLQGCAGIHTVTDNHYFDHAVTQAFRKIYIYLAVLFFVGLLISILSMNMTYAPLKRLAKKILPENKTEGNLIASMDRIFTDSNRQIKHPHNKLNQYSTMMKQSIFDSIFLDSSHNLAEDSEALSILFDSTGDNLFIIKISDSEHLPASNAQKMIMPYLSMGSACIRIQQCEGYSVFVIKYAGYEKNIEALVSSLFCDLNAQCGSRVAISNISQNPLDIPRLYENAIVASNYWNLSPVVTFTSIASKAASSMISYPTSILGELEHSLSSLNFAAAGKTVKELFLVLDKTNAPEFFIRNVMIDMLTLLAGSMNSAAIDFDKYCDRYFEALYYCRGCQYSKEKSQIQAKAHELLTIFEYEIENSSFNISRIKQYIQEHFTSCDFSIADLADEFHISGAYMSYLFSKNAGITLSDYVWSLRREQAKQLLENSELSIDDISNKVGYYNSSSFRRKFKQDMRITPS